MRRCPLRTNRPRHRGAPEHHHLGFITYNGRFRLLRCSRLDTSGFNRQPQLLGNDLYTLASDQLRILLQTVQHAKSLGPIALKCHAISKSFY
jgi:hypothetical protein